MPKNVARADYCFDKALGFLLKYQNMAIPDAMKLADFSAQEQACCAKRMCLYRLCNGGVGSALAAVAALRQSVCDSVVAAAGARWQWRRRCQHSGGVQLGGGSGSLASAQHRRRRHNQQSTKSVGSNGVGNNNNDSDNDDDENKGNGGGGGSLAVLSSGRNGTV
jgi:hypothetical protein